MDIEQRRWPPLHSPEEAESAERGAATEGKRRAALAALLLLAFAMVWPYRHFAGDDAYIGFRFARNLANGQGFAFNTGEPTYGATAPLWILLVAGLHRTGLSVPDAAHALNFLFIGLTFIAFCSLCPLYLRRPASWWIAGLLMAVDPWFVRWSMSGMENALALFLLVTAILYQQRWRNTGRLNWVSPLCGGLAILTRPEMVVFTALLFLDTLLFERRARAQNLAVGALIVTGIVAPWLIYAQSQFGTIIPNTIRAKISAERGTTLLNTLRYFGSFWGFQALGLLLALALRSRLIPARRGESGSLRLSRISRWFLPVAWSLALPALYVAGGAVAGRYLMLGLPAYLLIGVKGWESLLDMDLSGWRQRVLEGIAGFGAVALLAGAMVFSWEDYAMLGAGLAVCAAVGAAATLRRSSVMVGAFLVMTLGLVGWVHYTYSWHITRWPQGMDPRMIRLAEWLRDNTEPDDIIACDQIGVIGYISDRYVLDLVGLVSPEILPYRFSADWRAIWLYLPERGVQYLIALQALGPLQGIAPVYRRLELLSQTRVRREGAGSALEDFPYNLYRTHWPKPSGRADSRQEKPFARDPGPR